MVATINMLSAPDIGSDKFTLALRPNSEPLLPWVPITIDVDYGGVPSGGVSLPLLFTVNPGGNQGGAERGYQQNFYRDFIPSSLTFRVPFAGIYLVTLKEFFHNQWQGRLVITVEGEVFSEEIVTERS
jgi:hypothetical protein